VKCDGVECISSSSMKYEKMRRRFFNSPLLHLFHLPSPPCLFISSFIVCGMMEERKSGWASFPASISSPPKWFFRFFRLIWILCGGSSSSPKNLLTELNQLSAAPIRMLPESCDHILPSSRGWHYLVEGKYQQSGVLFWRNKVWLGLGFHSCFIIK